MILFLGCSNTYGQGLVIEKWVQEGKSVEFINSSSSPLFSTENMNWDDDEFRRKHHYPNLVAKHFNKAYGFKFGNGGSIDDMVFQLENFRRFMNVDSIEAVVVQFTDIQRNDDYMELVQYSKFDEEKMRANVISTISKIERWCNKIPNSYPIQYGENPKPIPWFAFSWAEDIGEELKKHFNEHFVPLIYKGKEYDCMRPLIDLDDLSVREKESNTHPMIKDGHPSSVFHRVMADSVIKKMEEANIEWKRYPVIE